MNLRTWMFALGLAVAGTSLIAPSAEAAKCLDCGGEGDDGYGEAPVLPTKPLCTSVCTSTSAATTTCYIYSGPTAYVATTCGAFGASSSSGSSGAPSSATPPSCTLAGAGISSGFTKSASKSESFGSSFIGASYSLQGSFSAKDAAAAGTAGDVVSLSGSASANGTLLYMTKTLASLSGNAQSIYGVSASGSLSAYVLGLANWSQSWNVPLTVTKVFTKTFFDKSYPIQLGIYTVTINGKVSGEARITASGGPTTTGLAGKFTPSVKAYGTATASVGVFGIGVGVQGNLTLVELAAPLSVGATFVSGVLGWAVDLGVTLKSLAGSLKVVITIPLAPDPSWTIFSWSGWSKTWNLLHQSGCTNLTSKVFATLAWK